MRFLKLLILFGVLASIQIQAQTGPGGVGNAGGTAGQAKNFMWYKIHEQNLANNAAMNTLLDYSGNGVNLTKTRLNAPTFTALPVFKTNTLNGLATATFNKSRMVNNISSFPSSQITTFFVYRSNVGGQGLVSYDRGVGENDYLLFDLSNLNTYVDNNNDAKAGDIRSANWRIGAHTWANNGIGTRFFLNGNSTYSLATHKNGAADAIKSPAGSAFFALGGELDNGNDGDGNGGNQEYVGDFAEAIVYGKSLNAAERLIVENYLSAKYGIALTNVANDKYAQANGFDFGVIGIGQVSAGVSHASAMGKGLGFTSNSGLNDGDFLFAGHQNGANTTITTDIAGVAGLQARWNRVWLFDETDAGTNQTVNITFDSNDYGIGGLNLSGATASNYKLLRRAGVAGAWTEVASVPTLNDTENTITFSGIDPQDGYYTIGTVNRTVSPLSSTAQTWYSFSTGNWSNPANWTLDASATPIYNNPSNAFPTENDTVIINSGRTISLNIDNIVVQSVEINGAINLLNASNTNFNIIKGGGIVIMDGLSGVDNFPAGSVTGSGNFADAIDGGTLRLTGGAILLNQNRVFNNVTVVMNTSASKVELKSNLLLNGSLRIERGDFEFDGVANRSLTVQGNTTILNTGRMNVANAPRRHQFNLYGDFLNEGIANFTNRTAGGFTATNPNDTYYTTEAMTGIVDFNLLNTTANQTVDCNNTTNFYRIEIDKGSDATYIAYLRATQSAFFNLYGYRSENMDGNLGGTDDIIAFNNNALGLVTGTVVIESNVIIPVLHRGNGNYCIGSNARLWIDGGTVRKVTDGNGTDAIVPYGVLEISDGILESTGGSGITLRINGLFKVDGGTTTTNNIRTSVLGATNVGGYVQSGGSVTVDAGLAGSNPRYYVFSLTYTGNVFSMSGGTLTVRGGTALTGSSAPSSQSHGGGIFINSDPGNQSVTGGTVIMESSLNRAFKLTSRAPFYNVIIRNSFAGTTPKISVEGGTSGDNQLTGGVPDYVTLGTQNLKVLNDLTIETGTTRTSGANTYGGYLDLCGGATCANLTVGRNLTINTSAVLDLFNGVANNAGSSSLLFNSSKNATLRINDITTYNESLTGYIDPNAGNSYTSWIHPFHNFTVDKPGATLILATNSTTINTDVSVFSDGGSKNTFDYLSNFVKVSGDFVLEKGTVDNDIFSILFFGNITNKGILGVNISPVNAILKLRRETTPVTRTITTIAGSQFGNVRLNLGEGIIRFTSDVIIRRLEYKFGRIDIGTHNLKVEKFINSLVAAEVVGSDYGVQDMIIMAGNKSDGGLSIKVESVNNPGNPGHAGSDSQAIYPASYPVPQIYLFPIGTGTTGVYPSSRYNPVNIALSSVSDDGYITAKVVSSQLATAGPHPLGNDVLNKYWNITHSGYSTLPKISRYRFQATQADIPDGVNDTEMTGVTPAWSPGRVLDNSPYTRVDERNNEAGSSRIQNASITDIRVLFYDHEPGLPSNSPFDIRNENYTAGLATKFDGTPPILYNYVNAAGSTSYNDDDPGNIPKWHNSSTWTTNSNHTTFTNPSNAIPGPGTIVVLNERAANGFAHVLIENAPDLIKAEAAVVNFIDNDVRLYFRNGSVSELSVVNGDGNFWFLSEAGNEPQLINSDIGNFIASGSLITYKGKVGAGPFQLLSTIDEYWDLEMEGFGNKVFNTSIPINVLDDVAVDYNGIFEPLHNVNIVDQMTVGQFTDNGYLRFPATPAINFSIGGDLRLRAGANTRVTVADNGNSGLLEHKLSVGGNIRLNESGDRVDLYNGLSNANAILEVNGNTSNNLSNGRNMVVELYKLVMNKTIDSTFTILDNGANRAPTFPETTTATYMPLEILNGTLILDETQLDVTIANGSSFYLPNTNNILASSGSGGLEVRKGIVKVRGSNTGVFLDGLLRVSGGEFNMVDGVGNGNNFIEYSSSNQAILEVSDGILIVGSQVRRSNFAQTGILKYRQTGGSVAIGRNNFPKVGNRGVFEVLNAGSEFTHTGGSFVIEKTNGSATVASLWLEPETFNFWQYNHTYNRCRFNACQC